MPTDKVITLALVGSPNCGKTSLYNALTGHRQKVANYAGVTVERRIGRLLMDHVSVDIVDLPGVYSFRSESQDQRIARAVIMGEQDDQPAPDILLHVIDATKLRENLRFVLEMKAVGKPMIVAVNMMDMAKRDGTEIDLDRLSDDLGMPVIPTVAVRRNGLQDLMQVLKDVIPALHRQPPIDTSAKSVDGDIKTLQQQAKQIADRAIIQQGLYTTVSRTIDKIILNPIAGLMILAGLMFFMFQAVFAWAETPMNVIDGSITLLQSYAIAWLPDGFVQSLVVNGVLAGVGSVIIFLPQILILFMFIMLLEQSGYMARAAFLMDNTMNKVGLSGHAFIPLLSSFACAIPGIMAARTIDNERDRLTTILMAPLITCSARLPVYTLIIAAFIPAQTVWGFFNLQGVVMFALYFIGIMSALLVALVMNKASDGTRERWFLMEMPRYKRPSLNNIILGLWDRTRVFIRRAGTIIMASTVVLWLLASYPAPPIDATQPDVLYSAAGIIGQWLEVVFAPIGFGWEICIALIPGMAAREVAVSALGTVYALQGSEEIVSQGLAETLQTAWSLPTALAFLAWYIFAPQCISTLAVVRRETNGWVWPMIMFGYLFALAYVAAGVTYHVATFMITL